MSTLRLVGQFITGTPWAITATMLREICRIYDNHLDGKTPDLHVIEAALGRPLANEQPKEYELAPGGVAIIPIDGVIAKKMDLFMQISGGASIERVTGMVKDALADPQVRAIMLKIDSPGGAVDGVFELAEMIYNARDEKPIIALAYGTMASAAYLIGAAASAVYATDVATLVGSIGVVSVHRDTSVKDAQSGIVTTEIYRGRYKRLVTSGPLTDEARLHMEEKVDYFYTLFVDQVARYRGVSAETVLATMSTDVNDLFIGQQAADAGLVDGILGIDAAITKAATLATGGLTRQGITLKIHKEATMDKFKTLADLTAAYPEFAAELRAEGVKSVDLAAASTTAGATERDRILGLVAIQFGEDAGTRFKTLAESGISVEQFRAIRALNPETAPAPAAGKEQQTKEQLLAALATSGAPDVGADGKPLTQGDKDYMTLVEEYMTVHTCSKVAAMQAVTAAHPELHREFIKKANEGRR